MLVVGREAELGLGIAEAPVLDRDAPDPLDMSARCVTAKSLPDAGDVAQHECLLTRVAVGVADDCRDLLELLPDQLLMADAQQPPLEVEPELTEPS